MSNVYLDGWDKYQIHDLDVDDMKGLLQMIKSAKLPERRHFNNLKDKIERILKI